MSREEIQPVFDAMAAAWARADAQAFARVFSEDADFTSVRGDHVCGSAAIASAHAGLFATTYAGTTLLPTVQRVDRLRPDIAVAHVTNELRLGDGSVAHRMQAQAVLEHGPGDGWLIRSFINMVPLPSRQ
ncbi:SgcJ/EcaC family oxidoreductase [Streptomyces sp. NPDC096033]|uniref:SgcJ/EcaC family oxidoreductase n=1 Tax=Streptomyces sp. NPDC096033 TaxID=3366071 RepID=UPI0038251674